MEYPKYQRIVSSFVSSLGSSDRFPHAPGAASEASETRGIEKKNRNRVSGGTRAGSNNCVATDVALMMLFHLPPGFARLARCTRGFYLVVASRLRNQSLLLDSPELNFQAYGSSKSEARSCWNSRENIHGF